MPLVIAGLGTLGVILLVLWLLSLRESLTRDREEREARRREEQEARERESLEAKRFEPGAPLHCLNCDRQFSGPMPADGCPACHLATLVVTEDEYQAQTAGPVVRRTHG